MIKPNAFWNVQDIFGCHEIRLWSDYNIVSWCWKTGECHSKPWSSLFGANWEWHSENWKSI